MIIKKSKIIRILTNKIINIFKQYYQNLLFVGFILEEIVHQASNNVNLLMAYPI